MPAHAKKTPVEQPKQPAELVREWNQAVRAINPMAELDFAFAADAITICDMTVPNALRYGILFKRAEINDGLYKLPGEIEKRVRAFMGN
jgi:hypothetical protein